MADDDRDAEKQKFQRTLMGIAGQVPGPGVPPPADGKGQAESGPGDGPSPPAPRTLQGMPSGPPGAGGQSAYPAMKPGAKRTMLGLSPETVAQVFQPPAQVEVEETVVESPSSKQRATTWIMLAAGLAVIVGGLLAFVLFTGDDGGVDAKVIHRGGREGLLFTFRDPEVRRVAWRGVPVKVVGNNAFVPVQNPEHIKVGDNELRLTLFDGSGEKRTAEITLEVDYRLRADLSGLMAAKPQLTLKAQVPEGAKVTVAGKSLAVTGGRASLRREVKPVTKPDRTTVSLSFAYDITLPSGVRDKGELRINIPVVEGAVIMPGERVISDRARLPLRVKLPDEGRAFFEGEALAQQGGYATGQLVLSSPKGDLDGVVLVTEKDKAPRRLEFHVKRVSNLRTYASKLPAEKVDYPKLLEEDAMDEFEMTPMWVQGEVYHVQRGDDGVVLQMLSDRCVASEQCAWWVHTGLPYQGAPGSRLRVWGPYRGVQEFRSEADRVVRVPRLEGELLLPLGTKTTVRRRRR